MNLHERYRPKNWGEVVGQADSVATLRRFAGSCWGGRAIWISGKSGQGKTTLARIYAAHNADRWNTTEIDASEVSLSFLREVQECYPLRPMTCAGKAYIINEAHGLRKDAIRKLLIMLEDIPDYVVWVFTTTTDGMDLFEDGQIDAHPLLSRCNVITLAQRGIMPLFAARAREIACKEGLNGRDLGAYQRLVNDHSGNMRRVLAEIENGKMKG